MWALVQSLFYGGDSNRKVPPSRSLSDSRVQAVTDDTLTSKSNNANTRGGNSRQHKAGKVRSLSRVSGMGCVSTSESESSGSRHNRKIHPLGGVPVKPLLLPDVNPKYKNSPFYPKNFNPNKKSGQKVIIRPNADSVSLNEEQRPLPDKRFIPELDTLNPAPTAPTPVDTALELNKPLRAFSKTDASERAKQRWDLLKKTVSPRTLQLVEQRRQQGIKTLEKKLEKEEEMCAEGVDLKVAQRPMLASWTIHPVYRWEAPNLFQKMVLPSIEDLEVLLTKQVLQCQELTYLVGKIKASQFGSSSGSNYYVSSGFYLWVTGIEKPEQILDNQLRLCLVLSGIKDISGQNFNITVTQLKYVDPALIGRVHEMKFPLLDELVTSLKCEKHVEDATNVVKKLRNRKSGQNSIKIDVTKIFCRCTKSSEVQLWISVEDVSPEISQKPVVAPAFIKFSGIQLCYEKVINKPLLPGAAC